MNITKELAQAVLNYLATQPYQNVYQLIAELSRQANAKPEEPKTEEPVKE
jgi:hypothetical protein